MANLNIRLDDKLKKDAEMIVSELGLTLSAATHLFLKQVVRCNGIPFDLKVDPFYSISNQERLLVAKERMERNGGTVHELLEASDD